MLKIEHKKEKNSNSMIQFGQNILFSVIFSTFSGLDPEGVFTGGGGGGGGGVGALQA